MPEDAFMLFPPGFGERSRRCTGIEEEMRVWEVVRPARPDPTIITGFCSGEDIVENSFDLSDEEERRGRRSIDVNAIKRDMLIRRRIRLRLIC